ncbi:MAG: hypothetical protein IJ660_07965, partial [Alphaproteobacteria bacterium]|nr:hypothetical protein [Alphaproteobacteria bacterium]
MSKVLINEGIIKRELHKWIEGVYRPTHFLTVQLPEKHKSKSLDNSITHLRNIMIKFERYLLGRHWNRKHLPFIGFAERGLSQEWHFHLLFNHREVTDQELLNAVFDANIRRDLPGYCLELLPIIDDVIRVEGYVTKELYIK